MKTKCLYESKSYRRLILKIKLNQHVNIFKLARSGDLESIKKLMEDKNNNLYVLGKTINWHKSNNKIIKDAAIHGHLNIVKYLIENCNFYSCDIREVLSTILCNGHVDIIKYYLEMEGNDHHGIGDEVPSFHIGNILFACSRHLKVIEYLLDERKFPIDKATLNHCLNKAIMFGNFEVVKYLVEKGADVDKEYMFDDPIDVAKRYTEKNKKILPYLLQKKGEITGYLVPQEPILNTGK